MRHQSGAILRGDDVYPHVAPGALLSGEMTEELRREWRRAQADSFEPAFARELSVSGALPSAEDEDAAYEPMGYGTTAA
jgi:hypothetical protein